MRTPPTRTRFNALAGGLAAAGVVALLVVGSAGAASAHDALQSSSPAAGDSLTTDPGVVTLDFSDELLTLGESTDGFAIEVVDSEGLHHESGCLSVQDSTVDTPIALGLAGAYVVLWQVVSSDGHPTSGQYEFDYEPSTLDGAHDGLTESPACGDAWAGDPDGTPTSTPDAAGPAPVATASTPVPTADATEATVTATDAPSPASAPVVPWPVAVLLGLVALGAIAGIVVLAVRRSRGGGYGDQ
ncbi:copper resistance protein CopC [Herbiconiux sp. CPCC 205763]|uniref:Copper resistance protein CopC n=1 Tax=Herbiconiux aconitum TaxID=2970913 RepID=A0ABT2GS51_9MICO|nr:copper resistance protein CopC [Herbiconiux aconitum]MCS5719052.1 copper resistance protein CopC [Herbiconiux aconitum]